jgi:hypothetical protein
MEAFHEKQVFTAGRSSPYGNSGFVVDDRVGLR